MTYLKALLTTGEIVEVEASKKYPDYPFIYWSYDRFPDFPYRKFLLATYYKAKNGDLIVTSQVVKIMK